ncbi:MAG: CDP-glycerol glycerophosphotransferase family protein [Vicinamibacterales bacterium]
MKNRAIFVSVPHGTSAGNMLRAGGLLDRLREHDPALPIVLFSPMARDAAFVKEFERPGVLLLDQPPHVPSGIEARLVSLLQAAFLSRGRTESVRIRMMEARANGIIRWLGLKALLGRLVSRASAPYALSDRLVSHPQMEALFDTHQPALVVCANPGLVFSEVPLMRTARRRGVPCMVIDASWDNFTNKLLPVRQADRLVVWNEIMKDQAVRLHGYRPEAVSVAGAPQFDVHFRSQARCTRAEFFQRIGADPSRKLIVLTTTPRALYRHHDHVLRELSTAIQDGRLAGAQVLVRLHPRDEVEAYREFDRVPHVIIEKPFRHTVTVADGLAIDVMPEHQRHLGDTLCHADVVVNVASTITIEACIFDTPVVNICFDGPEGEPYVRSATRYYSFTHYVNITNRGAVKVATSAAEMVDFVARYLADRSLDAEGRRQVVLDQCQFTDGHSAARVTAAVIAELGGSTISGSGKARLKADTTSNRRSA